MATDGKLGVPVRSEADGADQRVQTKIVDKSNPGTQQMTVDQDSNAHVESHGNAPDGSDKAQRMSEDGATKVDGLYDVALNTLPSSAGITAQTRNASASPTRQNLSPTAKRGTANTDTVSMDMSLHDENGDAYTASNPLQVAMVNEEAGTPVHDYNETSVVIAPAGSQQIDYTVAGTALTLKRIVMSCSAKCKIEVFVGLAATPPQKYTMFNAENNNNVILDIPKNFIVAVADIVRVKFTNMEPTGTTSVTGYVTFEGMKA